MSLLRPNVLECLLLLAALVCACAVRPWRLLLPGSRYELLTPLAVGAIALGCLWWGARPQYSQLASLIGVNLVLLCVGWPLTVLLVAGVAATGWLVGITDLWTAGGLAFWRGVVPATAAMAIGHALRAAFGERVMVYLLGRAFLVPLAVTFAAALLANLARDDFQHLGAELVPALLLCALGDAMMTGTVVALLVAAAPAHLATWSDALYLRAPRLT